MCTLKEIRECVQERYDNERDQRRNAGTEALCRLEGLFPAMPPDSLLMKPHGFYGRTKKTEYSNR